MMVQAPVRESARVAAASPAAPTAAAAPVTTLVDAIHDTLLAEMRADERVLVMGEDVGRRGGVFRATAGFLEEFGPERVIDTPLAEASIIGAAIGMAICGLRPVAEIQFVDFIHSALDQILNEAAKVRYRSNNDFSCPMVIRAPYGGGIHGALYHSQSIEAIFVHSPGLKVVAPITPSDAKGLLHAAIQDDDPVIFLEHKRAYRLMKEPLPAGDYHVPIGSARIAQAGTDATIITYGLMVQESLAAANTVSEETGASIEVIDLRTLKPLDTAAILDSVRKTGKVLVVTEANGLCSVASEVAALIAEQAFAYLDAPVMRVTGPDVPAMPFSPPLEHAFLVDAEKIAAALRRLVAF